MAPVTTRTIRESRFPLRELSLIGTTCIGFGQIAGFFLNDLTLFICVVGILCGVGTGVTSVVNEVVICQYFIRHRRTASGLNYAGTTLAACLFPAVVLHLIDAYGLQGALLISGGLTLNGLAGSLLFLEPPWSDTMQSRTMIPIVAADEIETVPDTPVPVVRKASTANDYIVQPQQGQEDTYILPATEENLEAPSQVHTDKAYRDPSAAHGRQDQSAMVAWLVVVSAVLTSYFVMVQCVLLDYAVELGMGEQSGLAMIALIGLGDLLARMSTQDIIGIIGHCKCIALICFLNAGTLFIMSVLSNAPLMMLLSGTFGATSGSLVMSFVSTLNRFLEPQQVQVYAERARLAMAAALLLGPVMVAVFKDTFGSYSGFLQTAGFLSVLAGLTWLPAIKNDILPTVSRARTLSVAVPSSSNLIYPATFPFRQTSFPETTKQPWEPASPSPDSASTPGGPAGDGGTGSPSPAETPSTAVGSPSTETESPKKDADTPKKEAILQKQDGVESQAPASAADKSGKDTKNEKEPVKVTGHPITSAVNNKEHEKGEPEIKNKEQEAGHDVKDSTKADEVKENTTKPKAPGDLAEMPPGVVGPSKGNLGKRANGVGIDEPPQKDRDPKKSAVVKSTDVNRKTMIVTGAETRTSERLPENLGGTIGAGPSERIKQLEAGEEKKVGEKELTEKSQKAKSIKLPVEPEKTMKEEKGATEVAITVEQTVETTTASGGKPTPKKKKRSLTGYRKNKAFGFSNRFYTKKQSRNVLQASSLATVTVRGHRHGPASVFKQEKSDPTQPLYTTPPSETDTGDSVDADSS
ncbi:uncharacterized protein LOC135395836 [Ornithodoros turicata]|uniref:uncharacterized protein LOC135395836 n=1 Tax=Ornithodoros turicata TaxID=34597 RepID=UPI003138ED8B